MISSQNIRDELRTLRRWKLTSWWLLGGFFPVVGVAYAIFSEQVLTIVGMAYFGLMMANGFRVGSASCPVCRRSFHSGINRLGIPYRNNLTSTCLNCGVSLDASESEIENALQMQKPNKP
jgi:hypothetical protein